MPDHSPPDPFPSPLLRRTVPGAVSDADYRRLVDSVTDYAIYLIDVDGYVQSWNEGARRMKGYDAAEAIGRHMSLFYPEELRARGAPEHALGVAQRTGRFEDEGWRQRKDGSRFWANVVLTRLNDADGRFRGYVKIARDLTGRRRQEELLRLSEERFRLLVEGVKDYAIFMLDPRGHVASWNQGAQRIKGYTPEEILGKHFSLFYPPEVVASGWLETELQMAIKEGRFEDEGWRVRKDGSRFWASVVITALFDAHGQHRGFAKVTRDLTEKRKLAALEDEGRRVTTFLAMLGHELRNPLAPMESAATLLAMPDVGPEAQAQAREVIERQVRHMSRLVDDLLDVSRITSGKIHVDKRPVRLDDVVAEAMESVAPQMRMRNHTVTVEQADSDLWVPGDPARLIQIVVNLLTNAAKFTPQGGRIAVTVRREQGQARIAVKDNGRGIPPRLLPQIFDLFVQGEQDTARSEGGLGLGLALVRQLVLLHGGEVQARSTGVPGEGSEFTVMLPCLATAPHIPPAAPVRTAPAAHRLLVVDDNRDAAATMALLLRAMGYAADEAHDGPAALEAILRDRPDGVLMDIGLPGLSGLEVARRVCEEMRDPPPMVAITGYGQDKDREACLAAGFREHVAKPVQAATLNRLLQRLFADPPR